MEQVKLLMTELSPELTRLCAETLAAQDIAVTVCEKDGAKALAALSAEKPDAVLLDAFMPGLDALTVKQRYDEAGGGIMGDLATPCCPSLRSGTHPGNRQGGKDLAAASGRREAP